jgi:hypothetical protein
MTLERHKVTQDIAHDCDKSPSDVGKDQPDQKEDLLHQADGEKP